MRNILHLLFAVFLTANIVYAQAECTGGRYEQEIFSTLNVTSNIQFGQNLDRAGANTNLLLDVYEPVGDQVTARPLIIWIHGGNFLQGDKAGSDVVPLAEAFAKMGYVTSSINYRVGVDGVPFPGPTESDIREAVLRAVHDAKAAVRYFYMDAAGNDVFKIDTNRIFLGGVSAGAVTALHYAYLDDLAEIPVGTDTLAPGMGGGLAGLSGNPGYSTDIAGVINIAGALDEAVWMHAGDEPLVSLHGDLDGTIPVGTGQLTFLGVFPLMEVDGSQTIQVRADAEGIDNCLFIHKGADHVPHVGNAAYLDTTVAIVKNFLHHLVCGGPSQCNLILGINGFDEFLVSPEAYPNPVLDRLTVELPEDMIGTWTWKIRDLKGKMLRKEDITDQNKTEIMREGLPTGLYLLEVEADGRRWTRKLIFH